MTRPQRAQPHSTGISPLNSCDAVAYPATPFEVQSETAKDDTLKEQVDTHVAAQLDSTGGTWSDGEAT